MENGRTLPGQQGGKSAKTSFKTLTTTRRLGISGVPPVVARAEADLPTRILFIYRPAISFKIGFKYSRNFTGFSLIGK